MHRHTRFFLRERAPTQVGGASDFALSNTQRLIVTLCIQDPENILSDSVLDSILNSIAKAKSGAGFFAWATDRGLALLLDDPAFVSFLQTSVFDLVVGIDTITTPAALKKLSRISAAYPNLRATIFMHDRGGALFHPKACWFHKRGGATLIVGSGNLTGGGLKTNWEAFSLTSLGRSDAEATKVLWQQWKTRHAAHLVAPDNIKALSRATQNERAFRRAMASKRSGSRTLVADIDFPITPVVSSAEILIGEVPRGSVRWNQVNVLQDDYTDFFGATIGKQRRFIFQHVDATGKLGEMESRPNVDVKSSNYRFELAAAAHLAYPSAPDRPIVAFVRAPGGVFRYSLLMPGAPGYAAAKAFLVANYIGPARQLRRVRATVATLKAAIPTSGLWKAHP